MVDLFLLKFYWFLNSNAQKLILARFLIRPILDPKFPLVIFFRHISICFNDTVDIISKEVFSLNFGLGRVQEFVEGAMTFEGEFDLKELM